MPDTAPAWDLGPALRELIARKGLSNSAIAEAAGLHPTELSRYINGRRVPRRDRLDAILAAIGTTRPELYRTASEMIRSSP